MLSSYAGTACAARWRQAACRRGLRVLSLYVSEAREWSDADIAVAAVLADVATSYVVNVSKRQEAAS
jgi:hypothetical protein